MPTRLVVSAVLALAVPAWGHHSHTNYDMTVYTELSGTVTEVHWFNPHIFVYLEVAGDAEPVVWTLEATSPAGLQGNGIRRDLVGRGDKISARCHRLKDGSNGCLLGYLTGPDGVERLWD
ncbi:MAG TPA: DUF6152 family protein [Gammaproteobacteria bacterium]|nr:DUF6152 family protein [Gammaproteobacteria bacterium]